MRELLKSRAFRFWAVATYIAALSAFIYANDWPGAAADVLILPIAPFLLGLLVRRWWTAAIPLVVLIPLPAVAAWADELREGESGLGGAIALVVLWVVLSCAVAAIGVVFGRAVLRPKTR